MRKSGGGQVQRIQTTSTEHDGGAGAGPVGNDSFLLPDAFSNDQRHAGACPPVQQLDYKDTIRNRPLTKYERTQILGLRAKMIARGAPALVDIGGMQDTMKIAEKEMKERKLNFTINRDGIHVELVDLYALGAE